MDAGWMRVDASLCGACERRMPREGGLSRCFRWCDDAQRVCHFWGVLRIKKGGSRQVLLYFPTLIERESDNLIERHCGHL